MAQHILPRRPSEALDARRAQVIAALRELGVEVADVVGSVARGTDTGSSDINLGVTFIPPRPKGFAWVARVMEIEAAVFELTGFPCDAVEDSPGLRHSDAPRIPLFDTP